MEVHDNLLVVVEVALITLELQEQLLLADLVEQVCLELVVVQLDQLMMDQLIEVAVVDLMVKQAHLIIIEQEMVDQVWLF
jgi:hypothetical protein